MTIDDKQQAKIAEMQKQFGTSIDVLEKITAEQFENSTELKELVEYYSNVILIYSAEVPFEIKNKVFSREQKKMV